MEKDLVIIGGGSSGLCAALSAFKQGIKDILILEQDIEEGGILNQCIHNGFGLHWFKEELTGPSFAQKLKDQIHENKIEVWLNTTVLSVNKNKEIQCINPTGFKTIKAKAIIFSVGCYERSRGAISIPGTRPKGIYTAGSAQKYLNQEGYLVGQRVFILGSGDIGLIMARRMTLEGAKVLGVAEIMPYSNGLKRNIVQCLNDFDIPLYLSHTVTNIIGKDQIEAIEISQVDENRKIIPNTVKRFDVDTLLLSVGLIPENSLISAMNYPLDSKTKGPIVDNYLQFDQGMFACGNGLHVHDLVDYVAQESDRAGLYASMYLKNELETNKTFKITPLDNIGYVVPQKAHYHLDKLILSFRVKKPMAKAKLIIESNNKVLFEQIKLHLFPAEMIIMELKDLNLADIKDELTIKAVEL